LNGCAPRWAWRARYRPSNISLAARHLVSSPSRVISYVVDLYRATSTVRAAARLRVLSFFAHLIAGPIVLLSSLPQLERPPDPTACSSDWACCDRWGVFKKAVIANWLAVRAGATRPSCARRLRRRRPLLRSRLRRQIYCDFSAYSDIAIAWRAAVYASSATSTSPPYRRAQSLHDFCTRPLLSLDSGWRDSLYRPLGAPQGRRGPCPIC